MRVMRGEVLYCPGPGLPWELGTVSESDYREIEMMYLNENKLFARQWTWFKRVCLRCKTHTRVSPAAHSCSLSGVVPVSLLRGEIPRLRSTAMPYFGYDFKSATPYAGFQHQAILTGIGGAMAYAIMESSVTDETLAQTFFIYLAVSYVTCFVACYMCHEVWGYSPEVMASYTTIFTSDSAARELMQQEPPEGKVLCISFTSGEECPSSAYRLSISWVRVRLPFSRGLPENTGGSRSNSLII